MVVVAVVVVVICKHVVFLHVDYIYIYNPFIYFLSFLVHCIYYVIFHYENTPIQISPKNADKNSIFFFLFFFFFFFFIFLLKTQVPTIYVF